MVNWYLEEISGDIESQEELLEKKLIVEKVSYLPDTKRPYSQLINYSSLVSVISCLDTYLMIFGVPGTYYSGSGFRKVFTLIPIIFSTVFQIKIC